MAKDKNIESKWHSDLDVLLGGWNTSSVDWAKVREDVIEVARTKYDRASFVEIGLEDICHQVLDQLSARLSPMLWARLPGEIVDYVIDCILPSLTQQSNSKLKRIISALSLVCKRWAAHCRPFLFHRLILIRLADPYYLHTILASPTSGWLGEHIQTITFKQVGSMSNPESSQSLCVNELPNVSRISYAYQNRTGGNGPIVPLSLRIIWGNMYLPLTSLQLETYRFRSVSVLLRTLGALRYLEDVQLYRVSWTVESNPDAMLQCKAGFSSIRRVRVTECQEGWPFAWLFAAASMGHTFKFLRRGEETTVPKDVMAIVRLCRTFSDPNYRSTIIQRQEPPSEYAFYYSLAHGDGDHSPRYEYELAFVAKPIKPLTGPDDLAQPTRVLNRLVVSVSPNLTFDAVSSFAWKTVDTILVDMHHLSAVHVLCGSTLLSDQVDVLSTYLAQRMPRTTVRVHHTSNQEDATTLEPELFKRRVWVSDVSDVFAINPIASYFSAPKYVRL